MSKNFFSFTKKCLWSRENICFGPDKNLPRGTDCPVKYYWIILNTLYLLLYFSYDLVVSR